MTVFIGMIDMRTIIREEVRQTFLGSPVPNPGEKGYKPNKHNLEVVFTNYLESSELLRSFENGLAEIEVTLQSDWSSSESQLEEISKIIRKTKAKLRQIRLEYKKG